MPSKPVRLGILRLTDAAPMVLAHERGLFAREGLDVSIHVEPSWANIADKLAWGLIEGAVMLPPLAIAMALGLRGPPTPLIVPSGISLNGNAITLAPRWADPILADGPVPPLDAAMRLNHALGHTSARPRLHLAVVHAFSTHDLLLRLFLEQGGIDPALDVDISVVPPPDMPAALAAGQIDGFCAGAPWGAVATQSGAGRTVAVTSDLWRNHPEKCLALNGAWAKANPVATLALVRAILRARRICDDPAETPALATLLAAPRWLGVDADLIAASLPGGQTPNGGPAADRSVFAAHQAGVPSPDHAKWFVRQMARWRELPPDADNVAAALYRPDLYAGAAALL